VCRAFCLIPALPGQLGPCACAQGRLQGACSANFCKLANSRTEFYQNKANFAEPPPVQEIAFNPDAWAVKWARAVSALPDASRPPIVQQLPDNQREALVGATAKVIQCHARHGETCAGGGEQIGKDGDAQQRQNMLAVCRGAAQAAF
jgi:hypothetical protein